jgi:ABC-2 type transport system permease protein
MVVQPVRVLPYFKHFFFFLVISHLVLAAFYFTVGTLTRNARIVYGLAVCFYPVYIAYQVFLVKGLPERWQVLLDPMLLNSGLRGNGFLHSADFLNRYVVRYSSDMMTNRGLVILGAAACLLILYFRFAITERAGNVEKFSTLNLATEADRVYYDSESFQQTRTGQLERLESDDKVKLPEVARANEGTRANVRELLAVASLELRLLRTEKSLVAIIPLAVLLSFLSLPFSAGASDVSYSASFASHTANGLLLFLLGVVVFYTGEAMHRDREVKIEPLLWSVPAPNNVLLLSKWVSTLLLVLFLLALVGLTAMLTQLLRGQTPIEISAYLITYSLILVPSLVFMAGASVALNVLLRDKYLAYAVSIATGAGLFYLYSQGYNHWLYNPVLYGLWTPSDLTGAGRNLKRILTHRVYCLAVATFFLSLAHLFFARQSTKGLRTDGRLSSSGWSILIAIVSFAAAVVAGLMIRG